MELPKGWVESSIAKIAYVLQGYVFPKDRQGKSSGKYPVYKVGDISNSLQQGDVYLTSSKNYIDDDDLLNLKAKLLPAKTVVMAKIGEAIKLNRRAILSTDALIDNNVVGIKAKVGINDKYLYYFYLTVKLGDISQATTVPSVRKIDIENMSIKIPPLAEQHRIVEKIDALFSELDKGVEILQTVKEQLRTYRQSVLKWVFSWELFSGQRELKFIEQQLKNVCFSIVDGDHQAPPQKDSGIPFLVISNINKMVIDFSDTRFVSKEYYDGLNDKRKANIGDILYSVTGSFGIPALVSNNTKFCFQRHIALLKPDKVISKYLFYILQTPQVYIQAKEIATGTAQMTVPIKGLREIKIPVPVNKEEQQQIVKEIESRLSVCDKLEQLVDENLAKADALRQSILKKAFEGRLVPQDPNDEPAEMLLERIKAERAAADQRMKQQKSVKRSKKNG